MEKEKIKSLPIVRALTNYIVHRAKRVLKLKNRDFHHVSIDVHPDRKTIWVWFHSDEEQLVGRAQFYFDGRCYFKSDYRKGV